MTRWQTLPVPLTGSQVDSDEESGAPRLLHTQNIRFTRSNTLAARPSLTEMTQDVVTSGVASAFPGGYTPQALHTSSRSNGDEVLLGCTNRLLTFDDTAWYDRGVVAPFTLTRVGGDKQLIFGSSFVQGVKGATFDMLIHNFYVVFLGARGQELAQTTTVGLIYDPTLKNGDPAIAFISGAANVVLRSYAPITFAVTDVAVAADWAVGGIRAFYEPTQNATYIAYGTTTPNQVRLAKVTSAGVVTSTTFSIAAPVETVAVTASAGKVLVAAREGTNITTKVYSTTLVDQAIDLVHVGTGLAGGWITLGCTDSLGWVAISGTGVFRRSMAAAMVSTIGLKQDVSYWTHVYMLNGRAYVGTTIGSSGFNTQLTISDVTDISDLWATAARLPDGISNSALPTPMHSGFLGAGRFVTFDIDGGLDATAGFYQFSQVAPKSTSYADCLYFSGSCPAVYDGTSAVEQGFNRAPALSGVAVAGGGLTAGSYTFQVTYRYTNAAGQVERSVPSLPVTVTTAAGNLTAQLTINTLSLTSKDNVLVEVWMTTMNPGNNAPLYLAASLDNTLDGVSLVHNETGGVTGSEEVLYTVGGILDAEAINADAGFTVSGGRLWAFSADRVWVSNAQVQGQTPWFNSVTAIPTVSEYGPPRAIEAAGEKVFLFHANGVLVTAGAGFNELAQGPGYATPQVVGQLPGPNGVRGTCEIPAGVAFQSDGRLIVANQGLGLNVLPLPEEIAGNLPGSDAWDLFANQGTDELYLLASGGGQLMVFNYRTLGWSGWGSAYTSGCVADDVFYLTDGVDAWVSGSAGCTSMSVTTNWVRPDGQTATSWSKVRELLVVGKFLTDHQVEFRVSYDGQFEGSPDSFTKSFVTDATTTWPTGAYRPQVHMRRQKCQMLQIIITWTSETQTAIAEVTGLEFKVLPVDKLSPNSARNRLDS